MIADESSPASFFEYSLSVRMSTLTRLSAAAAARIAGTTLGFSTRTRMEATVPAEKDVESTSSRPVQISPS